MFAAASNALGAFAERQALTAQNIANINTQGYKAKKVDLEEMPDRQGVRTQDIQEDPSPGPLRQQIVEKDDQTGTQPAMETVQGSNTRLINEVTSLMQNERAFEANTAVIRVGQQMAGRILDLVV